MSGDGGFLFSGQELETAVRLECNFVHLVWTDGFYDMVKIAAVTRSTAGTRPSSSGASTS